MVTRLRRFSTNSVTKVAAFILTVLILTGLAEMALYIYFRDMDLQRIFTDDYFDSREFADLMGKAAAEAGEALLSGELPGNVPYHYYISDGSKELTNVENPDRSFFEQFEPAFCALENGRWYLKNHRNFPYSSVYYYKLSNPDVRDVLKETNRIYIAYPKEYTKAQEQEWTQGRAVVIRLVTAAAVGAILAVILAIYLAAVTGRKPDDRELHPGRIDSVYSDILIAILCFLVVPWYLLAFSAFETGPYDRGVLTAYHKGTLAVFGIITLSVTALCEAILLALIRKIKAGTLIKHSLIYKFLYRIYDYAVSLFDGRAFSKYPLTRSLFYRQLIFIIISFVFVSLTFLFLLTGSLAFIIPPVLEAVVIYWYVKGNNRTYMDINRGFNESFEEQMKSERMKVALITNVSHDLKTPLTSIISYIDLLSKEDLPESARDYVRILGEKAGRLNNMVSDLFDLAKSTSGSMPVDIDKLDLKKLIEQTLADMGDRIENSGLVFRVRLPENPMLIFADGKKLYRVFQNVIDNALKYSLQGTRVYISLEETEGMAVATVKNTAGYEMDFTAEEILQRFARGDKSRTSEGSGLGLSIAESFTRLCGGRFRVDIDGDLFKVTVSFNLAQQ